MKHEVMGAFRSGAHNNADTGDISIENVSTFVQSFIEQSSQKSNIAAKGEGREEDKDNKKGDDNSQPIGDNGQSGQHQSSSSSSVQNLLPGVGDCAGFAGVLDVLVAQLLKAAAHCEKRQSFFSPIVFVCCKL
jgi:hypothetical protein